MVRGDVVKTFPAYLKKCPETIIAFAYFDLDIYLPTKASLKQMRERLTKGSVIGFDELALQQFPGETLALKETLGLSKYKIQRDPISNYQSFLVIE